MKPRLSFESRTITSFDDTPLLVHTTGAGEGPPIVLVGSPSSSLPLWRPQVDYLAGRHRFIAYDFRGLGGSGKPSDAGPSRLSDHLGDLLAVLDATGAKKVIVASWSIGAVLALELARAYPERVEALVLLCAVFPKPFARAMGLPWGRELLPTTFEVARRIYPLVGPLHRRFNILPEAPGWLKRLGFAGQTLDDDTFAELSRAFQQMPIEGYLSALEAFEQHAEAPTPEQLTAPTLVVVGSDDRIGLPVASRLLSRRLPFGELFVVRGGTHYTPLEFPELVNLRIEKFLAELATSRQR